MAWGREIGRDQGLNKKVTIYFELYGTDPVLFLIVQQLTTLFKKSKIST